MQNSYAKYISYWFYYVDKILSEAGIVEKTVLIEDITFNYAKDPDNGPPLLLLHAQLLNWYTYSLVLPELSENFHVYAVDYPGHGKLLFQIIIYIQQTRFSACNITWRSSIIFIRISRNTKYDCI